MKIAPATLTRMNYKNHGEPKISPPTKTVTKMLIKTMDSETIRVQVEVTKDEARYSCEVCGPFWVSKVPQVENKHVISHADSFHRQTP